MYQIEEKLFFLSYVDDCVYNYTSESLVKWLLDALVKKFRVKFLVYTHWVMLIRISQMKHHSISVDQYRYTTYIVAKYLYTATFKTGTKFYKTNIPSDMIFAKYDASTSDEKVEILIREFNINYKACIVSLVDLLSTRVDLSFAVHNLAMFSLKPVKVHFEGLVHILR